MINIMKKDHSFIQVKYMTRILEFEGQFYLIINIRTLDARDIKSRPVSVELSILMIAYIFTNNAFQSG